jgi:hypothetical protein
METMKDDVHREGHIYQGMPSHYLERRRAANHVGQHELHAQTLTMPVEMKGAT